MNNIFMMINDEIVSAEQPCISAWDRAIYFGDGVYEVVQAYNGRLWAFDAHFARFERSLSEIGIDNVDTFEIRQKVLAGFERADIPNSLVYFHITRGVQLRSHTPADNLKPQFLMFVKPAPNNRKIAEKGIKAISYPDIRWKRCDIKSLNLLPNVMACNEAKKKNCDDAVFVADDIVIEGTSSTFFAVIDSKLVTRPFNHQVLPGITRQAIAAIARRLGLDFIEGETSLSSAYQANELFLCGTGYEIRAIVELDGKTIGIGRPGAVTQKIIEYFVNYTRAGGSFEELIA